MMMRLVIACWCLLLAFFLSVTAYYVIFHHVSPLSRDQWHMLDALFHQGLWQTSITTVSGHRHILAFLLYRIDLDFFSGKNHFLIAFDWCLNISFISVLCRQVFLDARDRLLRFFLAGWIVVMLTWLLNIALLGWGFNGINNYMSIVNTVMSVFFLHKAVREPDARIFNLCVALLSGGLATLSFGNGILVWPIWFLCLFLLRVPAVFFQWAAAGAAVFFGAYMLLPGREAVGQALLFSPVNLLRFPVELMGGPLYHLLRAWRFLPENILLQLSYAFGLLVCIATFLFVFRLLRDRPAMSRLHVMALTLVCIGFGTTIMLTLTRVDGVLDPATDRFQIWALLVWIGLAISWCETTSLSCRRCWMVVFLVFPAAAFPSQLDWGARLAEYRTRVDNSLLAYQVYLPVAKDAEKALHWNWENKLPHLFPVLEKIRYEKRNIFADGKAAWLDQTQPLVDTLRECDMRIQKQESITAGELIDVRQYPDAAKYVVKFTQPDELVGKRWMIDVGESDWEYGVVANAAGVIRGLAQPVRNSRLPRFNGLLNDAYNAYAVTRTDGDMSTGDSHQLLLFAAGKPLCRYSL